MNWIYFFINSHQNYQPMKSYFSYFLLLWSVVIFGQTSSQNYTQTIEPKVPVSVTEYENAVFSANSTNSIINVLYKDGLDRNIQLIQRGAATSSEDIISHIDYDQFGRQVKKHMPFTTVQTGSLLTLPNNGAYVSNTLVKQQNYYNSKYADSTPFSETVFDGSPLNRPSEISSGGDAWKIIASSDADKTTKITYGTNSANEVRINTISSTLLIDNTLFYPAGTLIKATYKNENWISSNGNLNTIQTFSDKAGNKIADISFYLEGGVVKKSVTEYVYDKKGLLRYVLSPKASGYDYTSYNNSTGKKIWNFPNFLNPATSGGGSVTATINGGVLTISFSAGFNSTAIKTGQLVYLDERIPNTTLGILGCTSCGSNYTVSIQNGYLSISAVSPSLLTTDFNATYTLNVGNISFQSNQQFLDQYSHQYIYDQYNRKIEQKTPGRSWEYMIFDKLDRPILTQDANLKAQNNWLFTKYDAFGRVIYTGTYSSLLSRSDLQIAADNYIDNSGNLTNYDSRITTPQSGLTGGAYLYYSDSAFPTGGSILTMNYYDNYSFRYTTPPTDPSSIIEGQALTENTQGLLTVSYVKNLSGPAAFTSIWNYYDEEARPVRTYQKNSGYIITDIKYDFRGNVERRITRHKLNSLQTNPELVITDRFVYDRVERLLGQYQIVNNQSEEAIATYAYDDLGNLTIKNVGGLISSTPLQKISYDYNIKGWLTDINDVNAIGTNLFAYHLNYNAVTGSGVANYNGNISQAQWRNNINTNISPIGGYNYFYDYVGRMTSGSYVASTANGAHNEVVTYDLNGNIRTIARNGLNTASGNAMAIDNLSYRYDGNQLINVEDSLGTLGFNNGATLGSPINDYVYDANGNVIKDNNKGISNITYNSLDLPELVTFSNGSSIQFRYDATGNKLSKTFTPATGTAVTTDYFGGFQYQNGVLQFFPTPEGYVSRSMNGATEVYTYVYNYVDHLGNVRVSYKGSSSLNLQENFDAGLAGFSAVGSSTLSNTTEKLVSSLAAGTTGMAGCQKLILTNVTTGSRIRISGTASSSSGRFFTGPDVQVILVKYDASGNATEQTLSASASSNFSFEYYATTASSSIYLKFLIPGSSTASSFTLDNLTIYTTAIQTLSATNYYPFGLTHLGEFVSSEGSVYNYKFQGKELQTETSFGYYDFGSRLYEPSVGRWFTPDPQNQFVSPYLAMANNPINSIDPNGEWAFVDDVIAMVVGGVINTAANWDNIHSIGDGAAYFGIGAAAGEATLYAGPIAGAAITGFGNNAYRQLSSPDYKEFDWGSFTREGITSVGTSVIGGYFGDKLTGPMNSLYSKVSNELARDFLTQTTVNCTTGIIMDYGTSQAFGTEFDLLSSTRSSFINSSIGFGTNHLTSHVKGYYKRKDDQARAVAEAKAQRELEQSQNELDILESRLNASKPDGSVYSVAFEMNLNSDLYPGGSYTGHFKAANIALSETMASDATFSNSMSELKIIIPRSSSGNISGKSPKDWVWHHDIGPGVMQLVPKSQHPSIPGGIFWKTMHPDNRGGMSLWNKKL